MTPASVLSFIYNEARPAGLNILRIAEDGSKRPDPRVWKEWQTRPQSDDLIQAWFSNGSRTGVGIVCGFDGVESLDFDDEHTWELFRDTAEAAALELVPRIIDGWCDQTPGGGVHLIYRCDVVEGNQPLAKRPDPQHPRRGKATIETRGRGGLVVVAPSHGAVHPSGRPYVRLSGGPLSMVTITPAPSMKCRPKISTLQNHGGRARAAGFGRAMH
jgi:putative DNA primase/helicase